MNRLRGVGLLRPVLGRALSSCSGKERESPNECHQSLSLRSPWKPRYLAPCHEGDVAASCKGGTESQAPLTHGFITDRYAPLRQYLLDLAKPEAETI